MYIQRFSDEDLAQTFTIFEGGAHAGRGNPSSGCFNEAGHVNEARSTRRDYRSPAIVPVETAHRWA